MNSRYLFRGKRIDSGEWETGSLVIIRGGTSEERYFITDKMTGHHTPVDPATIGQCTGLKDKNGNLIFEGDIVELGLSGYTVRCDIQYRDGSFCAVSFRYDDEYYLSDSRRDINIIGNIHDNPDLLEVGE